MDGSQEIMYRVLKDVKSDDWNTRRGIQTSPSSPHPPASSSSSKGSQIDRNVSGKEKEKERDPSVSERKERERHERERKERDRVEREYEREKQRVRERERERTEKERKREEIQRDQAASTSTCTPTGTAAALAEGGGLPGTKRTEKVPFGFRKKRKEGGRSETDDRGVPDRARKRPRREEADRFDEPRSQASDDDALKSAEDLKAKREIMEREIEEELEKELSHDFADDLAPHRPTSTTPHQPEDADSDTDSQGSMFGTSEHENDDSVIDEEFEVIEEVVTDEQSDR